MADTVLVVLRWTGGSPWAQASDKVRAKAFERWYQIKDQWKNDPGIKFICYYRSTGGASLDGFAQHWIFEVDDASKGREMAKTYSTHQRELGPFEKHSFEIAWGDTETNESWLS